MANTYFTARLVQDPGRVTMTPTGNTNEYDLARAEGNVTEPGTPFNADTFNRIANQIIEDAVNEAIASIIPVYGEITANSNWTQGRIQYTRTGGMVVVQVVNLRRATATGGTAVLVGTLPEGFRPKQGVNGYGQQALSSGALVNIGSYYILPNGEVYVSTSNSVPTYGANGTVVFAAA